MLHSDRGTQYTSALYRSTLRKNEELPDSTVVEVIVKLVSNPKFAAMMQEKISMKVDTSAIEQEIAAHEKQLRQLMESLLSEVQIYEERQPNGQWLKSIKFKLPIIAEDMSLSLDNDAHIEMVCLLSKEAGEEQQR